jgi:hypothetical protein
MDKAGSPGTDYALTAGHCNTGLPFGSEVWHPLMTSPFGYTNVYQSLPGGSTHDYGVIRIPNQSNITDDVTHYGEVWDVQGVTSNNDAGLNRWFTGIATPWTEYGPILASNITTTACGYLMTNAVRMNLDLDHGDSGGPLYRRVDGSGIVYAMAVESCADPEGGDVQYMFLVDKTPSSWGLTVSTQP